MTAPTAKDPGGTARPGQYGRASAAPTCAHGRGSHDVTNFGAEWAGSDTRCLRFARWVAPPGRKTRFRLLARLYRVGSKAHCFPPKGLFDASCIATSFPRLTPAQARFGPKRRRIFGSRRCPNGGPINSNLSYLVRN